MRLTLPLALLALAACERANGPEPAPPAAVEAKEVAAADGYGEVGLAVNAIAFWSHPSVNFESLVIAATGDGLKAYNVESGELVSAAGEASDDVEIIYSDQGAGAPAQAFAVVSSSKFPGYFFLAIDNATGALTPTPVETGAPASGEFCAGRRGDGNALYEISESGVAMRAIDVRGQSVALGDPAPFSKTGGAACHVDALTGDVIAVSGDGAIRRLAVDGGESAGVAFAAKASASALSLKQNGGTIALLEPATAVVTLYDLGDGRMLGAVKVKSTFDLAAVASAKTIAVGYGNYGGVYRDGAMAVVTGDGAPIRLVPWNGVMGALDLPVGEPINPRAPQTVAADEDIFDIELKEP